MQVKAGEHPRVRGEHANVAPANGTGTGTPPRARGTRDGQFGRCLLFGNTPACAGNTVREDYHAA
jgi:hypothetical protein